MKLRFTLSFLFFLNICVNSFSYASQSLPKGIEGDLQSFSNKFNLVNSFLAGGALRMTSITSRHLEIFDQEKSTPTRNTHIQLVDELQTKRPDGISNDKLQVTRIRKVVTSEKYLEELFNVANDYNIDPLLLHAITETEISYKSDATSPAGAKGLMQIMPDTARHFGMINPEKEFFDHKNNLRISYNYLRSIQNLFGNDLTLIYAGHNARENAVIKYGYTIPPYREIQQYVIRSIKSTS